MAVCMAGWAIVAALTALVTNYTGLVLVRFFLGVLEAPFCLSPIATSMESELTTP